MDGWMDGWMDKAIPIQILPIFAVDVILISRMEPNL